MNIKVAIFALSIVLFFSFTYQEFNQSSTFAEEGEEKNNPIATTDIDIVKKLRTRSDEIEENEEKSKGEITPVIQKVEISGKLCTDVDKLVKGDLAENTILKKPLVVDSSQPGFQWVEAILIDSELNEKQVKLPVTIYDPKTTVLNDEANIAIDIKNDELIIDDVTKAVNEHRLNDFIQEKLDVKSWQMENGQENQIEIINNQIKSDYGSYSAVFEAKRMDTKKSIQEKVYIKVAEPLDDGWESASIADYISFDGYKIQWYINNSATGGPWQYTYNNQGWIFSTFIGADLIINGSLPDDQRGFLWAKPYESSYMINRKTQMLKRTFIYLDTYKIEITQQLLENKGAEINYHITNLSKSLKKIGFSQTIMRNGSYSKSVIPINDYTGVYLTGSGGSKNLSIYPDPQTISNWVFAEGSKANVLRPYSESDVDGLGWETGLRFRNRDGQILNPPTKLVNNLEVKMPGDTMAMKNPGVDVSVNSKVSFKQTLKYGDRILPKMTLDQSIVSVYDSEKIKITGTISAEDSKDYTLYLQMDDSKKTLISLKKFKDIPYKEVQNYQIDIEANQFTVGKHQFKIFVMDEYENRSLEQKLTTTIMELSGTSQVQKIKIGDEISNDLNVLFRDIKGTGVMLKEPLVVDSSEIGFQWVDAVLTDVNSRELLLRIPVNIYNIKSTIFNNSLALDVNDIELKFTEVKKAQQEGTLDQLVTSVTFPKAWDTEDGKEIPVVLEKNTIQATLGKYSATFKGIRSDNSEVIQKDIEVSVGGELKFLSVPEILEFNPTKLNQLETYVQRKDTSWKIAIENTLSTKWSLYINSTQFESPSKSKLKNEIIYKKNENEVLIINTVNQKIAIDEGEVYPLIEWGLNRGILLKVDPDAKIGSYTSIITWSLIDAP